MEILEKYNEKIDEWDSKSAIEFLLSNKNAFDANNEVDMWLYNTALGTHYYYSQMYAEALPCLRVVTNIIENNEETLDLASRQNLLLSFYWEANSEYQTHASQDVIKEKLMRAKSVYEKYCATNTETYESILSDLEVLDSNLLDVLSLVPTAIQYEQSNRFYDAIPLFEKIIQQYPSSRTTEEKAIYIQNLCNCYIAVGRLNEAEAMYINTLETLNKQDKQDLLVYRNFCDALGVLYCELHNYQKALDYSWRSKYLFEKNKDFSEGYIRSLSNCAIAAQGLNNHYDAKILIDVALKYMRQYNWESTNNAMVNGLQRITELSGDSLDVPSLSKLNEHAFKYRPYITLLSNAALINQSVGFWDEAVMCMKECVSLSEKIGEPNGLVYNNLATLYFFQNKIEESLPYFEKAISLCKTSYEKNEIYFNYALALWLINPEKDSTASINASTELTHSIMESFAFLSQEERFNFYKHFEFYLPWLNLTLYETENACNYGYIYDNILTTKGLLLRSSNAIKDAIMNSSNESVKTNYNRLVLLRQQIINESDAVKRSAMNKEIEKLDKELTRNAAGYGAFTKDNKITWQDIRANLNDNDIAIEFYNIPILTHRDTIQKMDGEPRYCAVILKKDYNYPSIIPLCKESTLEDLEQEDLYETDTIYRLIWQPLEKEMSSIKNVYFSADRELHKIGIEYALLPNGQRMDDIYDIYRLSSTRVLAEEKPQDNNGEAALFGGLRYDLGKDQLIAESRGGDYHSEKASRSIDLSNLRYGVEYLPGTKDEVEAISQDFKQTKDRKCETIIGEAGTEEAFRSLATKPVSIIHLATHGFFWTEEEVEKRSYVNFLANSQNSTQNYEDAALLRSGLFFSGANIGLSGEALPDDVEDGVLTAQELSAMNLGKVDMVVMSACQSGLGETSGEGIFGLQRGFKLAGANTLLMSLWKVDDTATKELMTEFYRHYLSGESKRESLRLAQQTVRKTHPNPEYWAAFILLDGIN